MKLAPQFPELESLVRRMDARPVSWRIEEEIAEDTILASELRTDGRILSSWEEIEVSSDGVLSFEGYQIALHIKDVQKDEQTLKARLHIRSG